MGEGNCPEPAGLEKLGTISRVATPIPVLKLHGWDRGRALDLMGIEHCPFIFYRGLVSF